MNDFTKEELQIISLDMTYYAKKSTLLKESPIHKSVREKIETMIDNYCEHDEGYVEDSMMVDICKKCNRVF